MAKTKTSTKSNSTADVIATLRHVNEKLDPVAKLAAKVAKRKATVDPVWWRYPNWIKTARAAEDAEAKFRKIEGGPGPDRNRAYADWNKLASKARMLGERLVKTKATTPAGWSAKVEVCMFQTRVTDTWLRHALGMIGHEMRRAKP
jgi:hypothetical protein